MNWDWDRKRQPDDVPTPIAVALSDFCRRAKSPASPTEVREALCLLPESDDFRVKALADGEPGAVPMGPFAAVDHLQGADAQLCARRQEVGYYGVARELARAKAQPAPLPPSPARTTAPTVAPEAPPEFLPPPAPPARARKQKEPTLQEKIAPKKRTPEAANAAEPEDPADQRELPAPKGRFTRLDAPKQKLQELLTAEALPVLRAMFAQYPHRLALHRALSPQYAGSAGSIFSVEDLDAVLTHHGLRTELEKLERPLVLGSVTEHRGALGRVCWALGSSPSELKRLLSLTGLEREVEDLRERFRREALSPAHLSVRLDLVGRAKYLDDLGIRRRFFDQLIKDLKTLMRASLEGATTLDAAIDDAARRHGVAGELLSRAIDKLNLGAELSRMLAAPSHP